MEETNVVLKAIKTVHDIKSQLLIQGYDLDKDKQIFIQINSNKLKILCDGLYKAVEEIISKRNKVV